MSTATEQRWKAAYDMDIMQFAGITKPDEYVIDFFGSAQTNDATKPFYYSNFGANVSFSCLVW